MSNDEQTLRTATRPLDGEERSLGATIAGAVAAGAATGVANQVAGKILNRPAKEPSAKVELPPGVKDD